MPMPIPEPPKLSERKMTPEEESEFYDCHLELMERLGWTNLPPTQETPIEKLDEHFCFYWEGLEMVNPMRTAELSANRLERTEHDTP